MRARYLPTCSRISPALSIAQGNDPSAPACATAAASSQSIAPAMGACTMGSSIPKSSIRRRSGHICAHDTSSRTIHNAARERRARLCRDHASGMISPGPPDEAVVEHLILSALRPDGVSTAGRERDRHPAANSQRDRARALPGLRQVARMAGARRRTGDRRLNRVLHGRGLDLAYHYVHVLNMSIDYFLI